MIARYSRPEMAGLWDATAQYASWLEVELAAAEAMAVDGTVPPEALEALRMAQAPEPSRVEEIESRTGHDVIAFLEAMEEQVGPAARYLHLGLTSSDVLDTSLALRCVRASHLLVVECKQLIELLRERAEEFRTLPMVGRSHGVHAEPMTFGLKILGWHQEFERCRARLERGLEVIAFGKLSGAVGTYNTVSPDVETRACARLGLQVEPVSTQVVPRDRHAEFLGGLALVAAAVERVATEIRGLQRTEVREVEEPFGRHQKGSSAMPHKRNPIRCENLVGLARLVRAYAGAGLENIALWHERDISHSSVERVALADACILVDFMLVRLRGVIKGLEVYPDNMLRNLQQTRGLVFSGRVLERLIAAGLERTVAYRLVQRAAMQCWQTGEPFRDVLATDEEVVDYLGTSDLEEAFDLRAALAQVDRVFQRVLIAPETASRTPSVPTEESVR